MYKGWTTPEVVPIYLFFIADKKKKSILEIKNN